MDKSEPTKTNRYSVRYEVVTSDKDFPISIEYNTKGQKEGLIKTNSVGSFTLDVEMNYGDKAIINSYFVDKDNKPIENVSNIPELKVRIYLNNEIKSEKSNEGKIGVNTTYNLF